MKVRKAVITAAGRGTRFLPVTKSLSKEMIPLVDRPLIQNAVEEVVSAGIRRIVIIKSPGDEAIEDYFKPSPELESILEQKGDTKRLQEVRRLSAMADISYVIQDNQLGLGHAVLMAEDIIGYEPFAVLLPDDVVDSEVTVLTQMLGIYEQYEANIVAVQRVSRQDTVKYGIIEPKSISERLHQVLHLVEKPEPAEAPSDLGVVGRYILMPQVFDILKRIPSGKNKEIQLTDALQLLLQQQALYAYEFEGVRYDAGTPLGWLKATVAFALKRPDIGRELRDSLRQILDTTTD
jgi:UTP--glucose-1-phosphate uridylyltransferase